MNSSCQNSIILIDKPVGVTSFDIIRKIKKATGIKRVGHSGVLDKNASGLLVCATNRATKLLSLFEDGYKIYEAEILFGIKTDTYDITGNIVAQKKDFIIDKAKLNDVLLKFIGEIIQTPPIYSNIKVNGKRLYKYALEHKDIQRPQRKVTINKIELLEITKNSVFLKVECSKGTYIRTLADDIGESLGVYGCVNSLKRIYSYPFDLKDACKVENIKCKDVNSALEFLPSIRLEEELAVKVSNGVDFCTLFNCKNIKKGLYRVFAGNKLISVIEKKKNNKVIYRLILPNVQI